MPLALVLSLAACATGPRTSGGVEDRESIMFSAERDSLPALERLGIKPDLCLAIDFNDNMLNSLDNLADPDFAADIPFLRKPMAAFAMRSVGLLERYRAWRAKR